MDKPQATGYRSKPINAVADYAEQQRPVAGPGVVANPVAGGTEISVRQTPIRSIGSMDCSWELVTGASNTVGRRLVLRNLIIWGHRGSNSQVPGFMPSGVSLIDCSQIDITFPWGYGGYHRNTPIASISIAMDDNMPEHGCIGVMWSGHIAMAGQRNAPLYWRLVSAVDPSEGWPLSSARGGQHVAWMCSYDAANMTATPFGEMVSPPMISDEHSVGWDSTCRSSLYKWTDEPPVEEGGVVKEDECLMRTVIGASGGNPSWQIRYKALSDVVEMILGNPEQATISNTMTILCHDGGTVQDVGWAEILNALDQRYQRR